ncbi:MAG TPA: hypothetical protein VIY47_05545, partial [Ignavibacteriaceae bacterium]
MFLFRTEDSAEHAMKQWSFYQSKENANLGPAIFMVWNHRSPAFDFSQKNDDFNLPTWNLDFSKAIQAIYLPEGEGSDELKNEFSLIGSFQNVIKNPFGEVDKEIQHQYLKEMLSLPIVAIGDYPYVIFEMIRRGQSIGSTICRNSAFTCSIGHQEGLEMIHEIPLNLTSYETPFRAKEFDYWEWQMKLDWNVQKTLYSHPQKSMWEVLGASIDGIKARDLVLLSYIKEKESFYPRELLSIPFKAFPMSFSVDIYEFEMSGIL